MKASLQLNLGQTLTLTPQLQQAIRLLQLSTLDLQQEIQSALDENLMLELEEAEKQVTLEEKVGKDETTASDDALNDNDIPSDNDLPVDTVWEDIYPSSGTKSSSSEEMPNYESITSATESLQDHLHWQLQLAPMSDIDRAIATTIIDGIEDDGLLSLTLEDIQESVGNNEDGEKVEFDEIEAVLHRIQHFDPLGVGARDLSECLLIQLQQLPKDTPALEHSKIVVTQHLELLGQHNYKQILRLTRFSQEQLEAALLLIQSLQPRPGDYIKKDNVEYIVPDVVVKKKKGRWSVELNHEAVPKLRINNNYASMVQRAKNTPENNFLRDNLQEARWFIKSLLSRNETLLKVATCIVEHQREFLEHGEEAMKPLVLHDIADALEMHESTISRVTTQKYMHTPRGVFELKYFFSSHVSTQTGGECSATAIRAVIKKLVAAENPKKPLSDNKIAQILSEQGVNVARRTIAKYRESLRIPASNERKALVVNKCDLKEN